VAFLSKEKNKGNIFSMNNSSAFKPWIIGRNEVAIQAEPD
jgi:hypothetical protein